MDPSVIAALITAFGGIVVVLLGLLLKKRARTNASRKSERPTVNVATGHLRAGGNIVVSGSGPVVVHESADGHVDGRAREKRILTDLNLRKLEYSAYGGGRVFYLLLACQLDTSTERASENQLRWAREEVLKRF